MRSLVLWINLFFRFTSGNQLDNSFSYQVRISGDHGKVVNTVGHFRRTALMQEDTFQEAGTWGVTNDKVLAEAVQPADGNLGCPASVPLSILCTIPSPPGSL
jgi:hypothetical protein